MIRLVGAKRVAFLLFCDKERNLDKYLRFLNLMHIYTFSATNLNEML